MLLKLKFIILLSFLSSSSFASVDDSTGVILKDGKVFILHKVEKSEGLYAIARRYKTVWTQIKDANPGSEEKIRIGQTLLIPTGKTEKQFFGSKPPKYSKNKGEYTKPSKEPKAKEAEVVDKTDIASTPKTSFTTPYKVKKGETLFSIAQKFFTTVDFLKQLNKLNEESIHEGLEILVPIVDEAKADSIAKQNEVETNITLNDLKKSTTKIKDEKESEHKDSSNAKKEREVATEKEDKKSSGDIKDYTVTTENFPEYNVEKITETGFGKVMSDKKINQTKDFVIHHNAPENTIIRITNPTNNKSIYAKVVKNFSREQNDPVIVYLTKSTAEYLGLSKKDKFSIKISFAK